MARTPERADRRLRPAARRDAAAARCLARPGDARAGGAGSAVARSAGADARRAGNAPGRLAEGPRGDAVAAARGAGAANDQRMAEVRQAVESRLAAIQQDNEKKLEQMRATVDEKLHATLEQRLGESFKPGRRAARAGAPRPRRDAEARQRRRLAQPRAEQRQDARHLRRGAARRPARAGVHAEQYATNVETVPASGARVEFAIKLPGPARRRRAALAADRLQVPARGLRAAARGAGATPTGPASRRPAEAIEKRLRAEARDDPREVRRAAAHHRLRHPVPADRRPLCRGAAPARPGRGAAARAQGHARRPDHAAGDADQPADGLSHAGAREALDRGLGDARRGQDRVRQVRRGAGEHASKKLHEASNTIDEAEVRTRADGAQPAQASRPCPDPRAQGMLPGLLDDDPAPMPEPTPPSEAPRCAGRVVRPGAGRADRRPDRAAFVHGRRAHGGAAGGAARGPRAPGRSGVLLGLFAAAPIVLALQRRPARRPARLSPADPRRGRPDGRPAASARSPRPSSPARRLPRALRSRRCSPAPARTSA